MLDTLLRIFVRLWKIENPITDVRDIDLIVAISYSTMPDKLVDGTRENLRKAIALKKGRPHAVLAFANCAHTFPGAEEVERKLKEIMLQKCGVSDYISAPEAMNNSIEEARVIKKALSFSPKRILIVTGEMHSRSVHYIWRKTFPDASVIIQTIPYRYEYQNDGRIWWQRHGPWVWFLGNVLRQVLIHFRGLDKVAEMHHGTKNPMPIFRK